jgi:hypothetical protein
MAHSDRWTQAYVPDLLDYLPIELAATPVQEVPHGRPEYPMEWVAMKAWVVNQVDWSMRRRASGHSWKHIGDGFRRQDSMFWKLVPTGQPPDGCVGSTSIAKPSIAC